MSFKAVVSYVGGPDVLKKELKKAVKEELQELVDYWHSKKLKKHFTVAGAKEYRYTKRGIKYSQNKQKYKGHQRPLVFSGDLRRMALRSIKISGTSKKATGRFDAPPYLYQLFTFKKGIQEGQVKKGQPDKAAELITVSQEEAEEFAKLLNENITKRLNNIKTKEVRRL